MLGVSTMLPGGNVTGLTLGSSIFSALEKRRPISLKGEANTLTRTFLIDAQMVSDRSHLGSLNEPLTGTLTTMLPLPSLMSATMSPSGSPSFDLTASSGRADLATRSFCRTTSFIDVIWSFSILRLNLYWRLPCCISHAMAWSEYGLATGSLRSRISPTRSR